MSKTSKTYSKSKGGKNNGSQKRSATTDFRNRSGNEKFDYKDRGSEYDTRSNSGRNSGSKDRGTNHIEWYVPDANMLASVANIPFGYRTGDVIPYLPGVEPAPNSGYGYSVAGIVRLNYVPVIGSASKPNDPVNVASTAVYSHVRHANSGSRNYDHSDLMMYLLAMDSIYSGISWLIRARGLAQTYNRMNRFIPMTLLRSMGIDHNEMIRNLTSYTDQINTLIMKATTLCVPANLNLFVRHAYVNSNVYVDESNDRAQMYYLTPSFLHRFQLDDEGRGMLKAIPFGNTDHSVQPFQTFIDNVGTLIDAIYGDEDAGIMSGDINKAYGDNLIKLSTISNEHALMPIYDSEMLHQIHNAAFTSKEYYTDSWDIKQRTYENDAGIAPIIVSQPRFRLPEHYKNAIGGDKMIDLHCEITPEAVMRSSRLLFTGHIDGDGDFVLDSMGTEVLTEATIYIDPTDLTRTVKYDGCLVLEPTNGLSAINVINTLIGATEVSFFPMMYVYRVPGSEENTHWDATCSPFGNTDKITVIKRTNIEQLNNVALLGLFNIPRLSLS